MTTSSSMSVKPRARGRHLSSRRIVVSRIENPRSRAMRGRKRRPGPRSDNDRTGRQPLSAQVHHSLQRQVFWLPDRPSGCVFPWLLSCRSIFPAGGATVTFSALVPGYSGGTATDSHRLPYSPGGVAPGTSEAFMLRSEFRMSTSPRLGAGECLTDPAQPDCVRATLLRRRKG